MMLINAAQIIQYTNLIIKYNCKQYLQMDSQSRGKLPMEMRMAKKLGIDDFLLRTLVFKKNPSKYSYYRVNGKNIIAINDQIYESPEGYHYQSLILQQKGFSVPVCHFMPYRKNSQMGYDSDTSKAHTYIVYAHGNCSDMSDSMKFLERMAIQMKLQTQTPNGIDVLKKTQIHFITFDYTGYGESRIPHKQINEKSICTDLEIVLSWLLEIKKISFDEIILWGFSLGTFPVTYCSHIYPVRACILQSPFQSISSFFQREPVTIDHQEDYLSNAKLIGKTNCDVLMMHSTGDEIVPFHHAMNLLQRYQQQNKKNSIQFLQVSKLKHNQMHKYICSYTDNPLKIKYLDFLSRVLSKKIPKLISFKPTFPKNTELHYLRSSRYKEKQSPNQISTSPDQQIKLRKPTNNKLKQIYKQLQQAQIQEQTELQFVVEHENGQKKKRIKNSKKKKKGLGCYCLQNC